MKKVKVETVAAASRWENVTQRSQHDRPLAAHLARAHIRQLELVLVNAPSEAAVKLFHPTTERSLGESTA